MTTALGLLVKLGIDTSDYVSGLDDAGKKTGGFSSTLDGLGKVGGVVAGAALGAVAIGAGLAGAALVQSTQEAMAAEQVQTQLNAVLKSTGGIAGVTAEDVNAYADAMSKKTMFDDEAIVSGESLMLTFTNIGSDVFPAATTAALDMSQAMGQDLQSSVTMIGKALQDPIQGVSALSRVGVNFTDEQKSMIEGLVEAGKLEEAQGMILKELQTEFGGSAEAAGGTFAGQLQILQTTLGNVKESVGAALLPALTKLGTALSTYLNKPEVQAFIAQLATNIGNFAMQVVTYLPAVVQWFQNAFGWLGENQGVIVGVLAAIGVAVAAFVYTTVIPAAIAAITAMAPIILVMAAIAAIAYLVYTAWTQNWGGIQEKVAAAGAFIAPIIDGIVAVLTRMWGWIKSNLLPLFVALGRLIMAGAGAAFRLLASYVTNTLVPALKNLWSWFSTKILPVLTEVGGFLSEVLKKAFQGIASAIQTVISWIDKLTQALEGIAIPDNLTPGSPTPFEMGLRGIASALREIHQIGFPALNAGTLPTVPAMARAGDLQGNAPIYLNNYGTIQLDGNGGQASLAQQLRELLG